MVRKKVATLFLFSDDTVGREVVRTIPEEEGDDAIPETYNYIQLSSFE